MFQFAQSSIANEFAGKSEAIVASLLASRLKNSARLLGNLDEVFSFINGQGEWLFAVNIFARPHGGDRDQGVPVVDRSANDDVDIGLSDEIPEVPEDFSLGMLFLCLRGVCVIDVADRDEIAQPGKLACIGPAHPAAPHQRNAGLVIGRFRFRGRRLGKALLDKP